MATNSSSSSAGSSSRRRAADVSNADDDDGQDGRPLLAGRRRQGSSPRRRRAELDAAFDSGDESADLPTIMASNGDGPPGYDVATASSSSSRGRSQGQSRREAPDVFFDAGEAMHDEPPQPLRDPLGASHSSAQQLPQRPSSSSSANSDPLRAEDLPDGNRISPATSPTTPRRATANETYDFERPAYFRSSSTPSASRHASGSMSTAGPDADIAEGHVLPGDTGFARARRLLGRFGRYVGMRVPGAAYSSLEQEELNGVSRRRRVVGGGLNHDGVFANLNAKPEGRRRRANAENPDDRGEDDDLAEETLPPTYEIAAADAAPGYWETTIAPGGMGWTPGGAHVGEVEDLILEGLPIGNLFGFAWNLLVSMSFQFVGFLLTYLLHTTHAARCGSRAGLGITLVQYGFYLRARAASLAEGGMSNPDGIVSGGSGDSEGAQTLAWLGGEIVVSPRPTAVARSFFPALRAEATATPTPTTVSVASALAADATSIPLNSGAATDVNVGTSEWLAYALMVIGWFLLLSSLLSYLRVYRWGRALVAASRREQESTRAAENGGTAPELTAASSAPVGFIHRLSSLVNPVPQLRADGRTTGTGEDWIVHLSSGGVRSTSGRAAAASASEASDRWGDAPRAGSLAYPIFDTEETDTDPLRARTSGENNRAREIDRQLTAQMRSAGFL